MSFGQERIWFTEQLTPGTSGYVVYATSRLRGPLEPDLVRTALDEVAARHDSLRMRFLENDRGEPVVEVLETVRVPFTLAEAVDEATARMLVAEWVRTPFDLTAAPLLRALVVRLADDDHVLHLDMHHIVSDGWSMNLLLNEVATVYGALRDAAETPAAPAVRYVDYAAWQRDRMDGAAARDGLAFWTRTLAGVPPLDLPTDRPRPAVQSYAGGTHRFRLDAELTEGLRRLGRAHRATLYMTLLAGLHATLFRYSGQRDFAVGSPVAGRVTPEAEELIGLFVNTLALRADLSREAPPGGGTGAADDGEPTFGTLLRRTRNTVVRALANQEIPFERLVKELNVTRDVSRTPVFQVLFTLQNYARTTGRWPTGLVAEGFGADGTVSRFDLSLYVSETDTDLRAMLVYNSDLFTPDTAARFADALRTLLRAAVDRPDRPVVDLPLLDPAEQARMLALGTPDGADAPGRADPADGADAHNGNDTDSGADPDSGTDPAGGTGTDSGVRFLAGTGGDGVAAPVTRSALTLADLVTPHAATSPDVPAVVCGADTVTYRDLDRRANQLAHHLRTLGVGPDALVGVLLEQSADLAVALLGVLRAGGAYLPLDPEQPRQRLALMLADARPAVVLTSTDLRDLLPTATDGPVDTGHPTDTGQPVGAQRPAPAGEPVCLDTLGDVLAGRPVTPPEPTATGAHLAYVIYTSGSTGRPKGVAVAHRQVLRYLDGVADRFGVVPGSRYALLQSMSFDFSVTVFYLALATGGTVHLLDRRCTGGELADRLRRHRIDYLKITPSHLAVLAAEVGEAALVPTRALILGGEASDLDWAARFAAAGPGRVFNHYGPTEATVGVTTYEVTPDATGDGPVPLGRPLPHARVYVLDERLRPVPVGVPGEIHLGGDRLARGYLHQPELTDERFVPDPYGPPGARLYRTGDLGRWRADGQLVFLGRRDHQVKIRGYRVELGEVEAALRDLPPVRQAAVLLRDGRLVAWLEHEPGTGRPEPAELRRVLGDRLPDHMVPYRFVWLDRLPLQEHGKVDRRALPEPVDEAPSGERIAPDGPVETLIAGIWQVVLGVPEVGATDDFFDIGGHSLLATQVVARLRRELPAVVADGDAPPVTVMDLFRHRTVRDLAARLAVTDRAPDGLLHELTPPVAGAPVATLVCVPYGGGSAVVYQPLADALPAGYRLLSVAVPGHDIGLADEPAPIDEVAATVVAEILDRVTGPLVLYGHCGPGGALAVEAARRLEAAGRELTAVYLGAVFPFGRPPGGLLGPLLRLRLAERIRSDRIYRTWLQAQGTSIGSLDPDEVAFLIRAMRHDARVSEEYFTDLLHRKVAPLRAPIISVVGEQDRGTEYHEERFREWHFLSDRTALAVIDEGGHYFLKYRAAELAEIVTGVHDRLAGPDPAGTPDRIAAPDAAAGTGRVGTGATGREPTGTAPAGAAGPGVVDADGLDPAWELVAVSDRRADRSAPADAHDPADSPAAGAAVGPAGPGGGRRVRRRDRVPQPSMARFGLIAAGQIMSGTGTALTNFAIPLWIYLETGSLARFALFAVLGLLPGLVVAPLAGALIDRSSRRRIMILAGLAAGGGNAVLAALVLTDQAQAWHFYLLVAWLSVALAFQRLAFVSAVPQLVPKRYLGHANGLAQTATGITQFLVPLISVALLEAVGLRGILIIDVVSYAFAIGVLAAVRFPRTLALRRREGIGEEIMGGLRYALRRREFRAMLAFFAALNLFLFPVLFLLSPLVLGFADLAQVARIALTGGVGAATGGLVMLVWGGPRTHRMRAVLLGTLGIAVACVVTGLRPNLLVIGVGAFGMYFALGLVNGVYNTIVQTKVPPRFHGRVFALNQMVAWSTLPLGWGVIAPFAARVVEPMLLPGGALAPTVGAVIGVGPGRGHALLYLVFGVCIALTALVSLRTRILSRFDLEVPDAPPDDLVGIEAREARAAATRTGGDRT
ncbi:non-ribosomal peptide synthetase [Micromonospora rosaria]|uniref:Non-ribosomal peptide synthetase n=1 Tax=Micromonospora rosaria TaxID=47874 RepID=A0A136PTB7_9ACTN|nr:non-ribosomal peptide synthetase/MFS transporter [Micromonospora rosaria]KXK61574.1 non-ribosomal peptide synthetase [Micromonospora rosaria]